MPLNYTVAYDKQMKCLSYKVKCTLNQLYYSTLLLINFLVLKYLSISLAVNVYILQPTDKNVLYYTMHDLI